MTVTAAELHEYLTLDEETGRLFWRKRPREMFSSTKEAARWNTRYARKEAFTAVQSNGYKSGRIWGEWYAAHRVVWALVHGEWPAGQIDHIDGDRLNNRPSNLRDVTHRQNTMNRGIRRDNATGVVGVVKHRRNGTYDARISDRGKRIHLGCFTNLDAAREARRQAEVELGYHRNHGQRNAHQKGS